MFSLFKPINVTNTVYTGLTACHICAAFITDKPILYGSMAVLYAVLALHKK